MVFFFFFKIMLESWGCGLYKSAAYTRVFTVHYSNWRLKICIWRLHFSSWSPKGDLRIYIISSLVLATEVYAWTVTLLPHKRSTRCPLIYHHLILTLDWKFRWYILSHFVFTKWNSKPWHIFKVVIKALLWSVWAHKDYFERLSFWTYLFIGLNQLWCESSAWWALQKNSSTSISLERLRPAHQTSNFSCNKLSWVDPNDGSSMVDSDVKLTCNSSNSVHF